MNKLLTAMFLFAAPALFGQSSIHVFGGWAYGRTDGDTYLTGTRGGELANGDLSVNLAATPMESLRLEAQFGGDELRGVRETSMDYAFAEWRVSDALRLRAGRLKHPFGIYSEVYDVGTLRPFYSLPASVYGPSGTVAEAYGGGGVSGFRKIGTWGVTYDLYAGKLELPFADFDGDTLQPDAEGDINVRHVVGGGARPRHRAAGAHVEYVNDRLSLRNEWIENRSGASGEHAGYVESAWRFTRHWQAAGRIDGHAVQLLRRTR